MAFDSFPDRLARVRDDIVNVQAREGATQRITIVAVTKGHGPDAPRAAVQAGLVDLGENRVQEALEKQAQLPGLDARWHLIGHLQTNKAKLVPPAFARVHSVDSWKVAEALDSAVRKQGGPPLRVLLQVNIAGEEQKSGCEPGEAAELAARIAGTTQLQLDGLMTMAPLTEDESVQRKVFGGLRRLRDTISEPGVSLPELSMGMSGDFRAAVAEGATILRLGTILFGERQ